MWFKIKSLVSFLLQATNQHGVHSPFVFNFITNCFYKKANPSKIEAINSIRKSIFQDHKIITVTDFGSGSKVFKYNDRRVADIAKIAGMNKKKTSLLVNICEYLDPQNILEIGTSVGLGASTLSIGCSHSQIHTLEGCKNTAKIAQELFQKFNLKNIQLTIGNFNDTLPNLGINNQFDLVYFDGNHQKKATLRYFKQCLPAAGENTIFIFDDINWSVEMQQAWEEIKMHPKVTVTINTYFWGIVFFKTALVKQHFTIRC